MIFAFIGLCAGLAGLWLIEHLMLVHADRATVERLAPLFPHRGVSRR